jgi:hypothetical protein
MFKLNKSLNDFQQNGKLDEEIKFLDAVGLVKPLMCILTRNTGTENKIIFYCPLIPNMTREDVKKKLTGEYSLDDNHIECNDADMEGKKFKYNSNDKINYEDLNGNEYETYELLNIFEY